MKFLVPLLMVALLVSNGANVRAQSTTNRLTVQEPAEPSGNVVRDPLGKACLDVEAAARPQSSNHDMLDHVVSIKNNCLRPIKVKLCYYKSESCKQFDVQAYKRVDTILGAMRGVSFFRYSVFQK
ncbi:hypothetical protein ACNJX9_31420 [Bradyrhizobium sp. DASA03076]|uniref:hypothetical protein n=1 Tax=Bradyrhizobium sp. BLXBL-03 TaxID=3395916 RepID=UPI003F6F3055